MYFSYISFQLKKNRFDFLFNSNSLLDIHAGFVYFFLKKDNYCIFNIKEWNQSNDVIFMSLNCSILLFWSFCVFLWTYIHYAILFYMASTRDGLYGENKTFGKCNKQKIQFFLLNTEVVSLLREGFKFISSSCFDFVKKSVSRVK